MTTTPSADEARITQVLDEFSAALRRKDAKAAVAVFDDEVVSYDLAPPLSTEGRTVRDPAGIQSWFDTWSSPIESTTHDLRIRIGGEIAYAFGLVHMVGTKKDGERVDLWFRGTTGFVRRAGGWKIAHVHNSVPFAMDGSGRALLDLKP